MRIRLIVVRTGVRVARKSNGYVETFRGLKETAKFGEWRIRHLVLEAWDRFGEQGS